MFYNTDPVLLLLTLLLAALVLLFLCITAMVRQKNTHTKIIYTCENMRTEANLLRTKLEIQDHTLDVVYQQLQDNIGQMLSCIHMKLHTLRYTSHDKRATETFTALASGLGGSIKDIRNLSHAVSSETLVKAGLIDTLQREITFFSSINNLACIFTCADELPELSLEDELYLFRLIQEMMWFMFHHFSGSPMNIQIVNCDEKITVNISAQETETNRIIERDIKMLQNVEAKAKLLKGDLKFTNQNETAKLLTFTYNAKR